MSVVGLHKDLERHTMTIHAEYPASVERVWQLWADPRQLERWWGPPSHPATVTDHDFSDGGVVRYFMTGPNGERYHGGWRVKRVQQARSLEFEDFFADDDGTEKAELPVSTTVVSLTEVAAGMTRMTIETCWPSSEAMVQVLDMGMEEGIQQALGQIDALLAE